MSGFELDDGTPVDASEVFEDDGVLLNGNDTLTGQFEVRTYSFTFS